MTSDTQVSNARRVFFTALALVAFWVAAWKSHGLGWDYLDQGLSEVIWVLWGREESPFFNRPQEVILGDWLSTWPIGAVVATTAPIGQVESQSPRITSCGLLKNGLSSRPHRTQITSDKP